MKTKRLGFVYLILVTLVWGLSFCLVKALNQLVDREWKSAAGIMGLRFLLAAIFLIILNLARTPRLPRLAELWQGLGIAGFSSIGLVLQAHGLNFTNASTSAFLTQGATILVPLWVTIRNRRFPQPHILASLALVGAGVWILSGFSPRSFSLGEGELETLLGCFFFAGMILMIESPSGNENNKVVVTAIFLLASGLFGLLVSLITSRGNFSWIPAMSQSHALAVIALLSLFSTTLAFLWMIQWQPSVTATEAGIIYCLEPVWASLLSLMLPAGLSHFLGISYSNEHLTPSLVIGGGFVLLGCVVLVLLVPPAEK